MKTTLFTVLTLLTFNWCFAQDQVFHHSQSSQLSFVDVQNLEKTPTTVWLLFYQGTYLEEVAFEIPAQKHRRIDLTPYTGKSLEYSLVAKSRVGLSAGWKLDRGTLYQIELRPWLSKDIEVLNLYAKPQTLEFKYFNSQGQLLKTEKLKSEDYLKSLKLTLTPPASSQKLLIQSESSLMLHTKLKVRTLVDTSRKAKSETTYFLVQSPNGESFVAPIEEPELIEKAREEILHPRGFMVVARVGLELDQPNRNFHSTFKEYWGWSIERVTNLSQVSADWCVAYPSMIERMIHPILEQKSVCFRGQKILKELSSEEVESGRLRSWP